MAGTVWRARSAATAPDVVQALSALRYVHERNDGLTAHLRRGEEHLTATGEPDGTALAFDGPLGVPPPDVMAALGTLPGFTVERASSASIPEATVFRHDLPTTTTGAAPNASGPPSTAGPSDATVTAASVAAAGAAPPPPPLGTTPPGGVTTLGETTPAAGPGGEDHLDPAPASTTPAELPPYLRITGMASIVVGLTLLAGTVASMVQTKDVDGIDGWPFLGLSALFLIGGIDALRGSRVGLAASGAAAGGFALIMFFAMRILSVLFSLAKSVGSTASLGATLVPWAVAAVLAGVVFIGGLIAALAPDEEKRSDGLGAFLVLIGAAVAMAGVFLVATGKPSARGIVTGEATSTVVAVGLVGILVVGALLAAAQRTPASFAFAAGGGLLWLVVSAANAEAIIGGRTLGSVDRADLALTLGGAALVAIAGAFEAGRSTSGAGSGAGAGTATGVVAILGAVAGLILIIPVLSTAKGQSLTATGSGLDGLTTLRSGSSGSPSSGSSSSGSSSRRTTTTTSRSSSTSYRTTTTTRPTTTTTTRRTTTTTARRNVTATVQAEGCGSTCRIYRRFTPFDDLTKKGGSYRIDGDRVTIRCVTTGQPVKDGDTGRESSLWYQIDSDWWMSAVYLSVSDPSSVAQC